MMVRIVTDSTCDLPGELLRKWEVSVLHLEVRFGNEVYRDGINLSVSEFYEKLAASEKLPTTSQITPDEFEAVFRPYTDRGDDIVGVFLSSELSGTCQSAFLAKEDVCPEHIFVVDSRSVTFGLGLLVWEAVRLRDEGHQAAEIARILEEKKHRMRVWGLVDTLEYLEKGGRISSTSAKIGSFLGIKPIIAFIDGKVEAVGKARSRKAGFLWIDDRIDKYSPEPGGLVTFGHSNSPEALQECMAFFSDRVDTVKALPCNMGCTVGAHVGPGAVGIAYFERVSE